MRFRGGEFSTGTMGNFQPELTNGMEQYQAAILKMNSTIAEGTAVTKAEAR